MVIGNAIPQFKQPADLNSEKSVHKIVTVGRLVYSHKRPHLLIDAFAKVAKDFPQWNLEFWGASDGKAYYEELKLKIKKHGLQDRIFLRGTTQNVPDVLRQCDIFAMPSAYEGFSLSLGEAMSMGLPVIAYKSCRSIAAIVTDNVHGFLCEDGIEDFAAKLHILMGNKELRIKMGKEGRKLMRNYSPKVIWDTWETLMNRVVQQKNEKGV